MVSTARVALDRLELLELRGAYGRAIDRENYGAAHDIFTEDAVVHYRTGTLHGPGEVVEYWREEVDYEFSMHIVQMPDIDIDGDKATGRWYMVVYYAAPDGTEGVVFGWYEDEYRRVDGEWKVATMDMDVEYDTGGYHT